MKYKIHKFEKTIFSYLSIICICFSSYSCFSPRNDQNAAIIVDFTGHNFGKIPWNKEVIYIFNFTNPGKTPLIINDVKTSCGCTVPEWTKKPIKPGGKGEIKIKYDAAFPGVFHKTVEVFYNGPGSSFNLEIRGEVEYPEDK